MANLCMIMDLEDVSMALFEHSFSYFRNSDDASRLSEEIIVFVH
jgi:hypothetical protein